MFATPQRSTQNARPPVVAPKAPTERKTVFPVRNLNPEFEEHALKNAIVMSLGDAYRQVQQEIAVARDDVRAIEHRIANSLSPLMRPRLREIDYVEIEKDQIRITTFLDKIAAAEKRGQSILAKLEKLGA